MSTLLHDVLRPSTSGMEALSDRLAKASLQGREPFNDDDEELVGVVRHRHHRRSPPPAHPALCRLHSQARPACSRARHRGPDRARRRPHAAPAAVSPPARSSSAQRRRRATRSRPSPPSSASAYSPCSPCATSHAVPSSRANGTSPRPSTTVRWPTLFPGSCPPAHMTPPAVWFQHYRRDSFHDEFLPQGKWTRRESKLNWVRHHPQSP